MSSGTLPFSYMTIAPSPDALSAYIHVVFTDTQHELVFYHDHSSPRYPTDRNLWISNCTITAAKELTFSSQLG
jgi:hypothetical protein